MDCTDCGDDIGMLIECHGWGRSASASIYWAALDTENRTTGPLSFEVAGEVFRRTATSVHFGQLGEVPRMDLAPSDPLLVAMQKASHMRVTFADSAVRIGLGGFASAYERFDHACPWRADAESFGDREALSNEAAR